MTAVPGSDDTLDITRQFIDALNEGDKIRFASFLDDAVLWHSAATDERVEGRGDVADNLFGYRNTFPDLHEEISNAFASGDQAAVETVVTGTYGGTVVPTIAGSGQHVRMQLCYLLRVRSGKIVQITTYMDYRTLMAQLDMIMSPATGP